jgi:putative FmdB family regulatory protein
MPIYEYRCATCEGQFGVLARSTATAPVCPTCGSPPINRLFSVPHVLGSELRRQPGHTCCGREERCSSPPCPDGSACNHG